MAGRAPRAKRPRASRRTGREFALAALAVPILATLLGAPGPVVPVPMSSKPAGVAEGLAAEGLGAVQGPVLEVGDSLGVDLGWGLATALEGTGHAFVGAAVGDTGLAEPEYYNWPAHLASDLSSYRPGLVVVFLGANDVENLYSGGRFDPFGTKPWAAAYGQRVSDVLQEVRRAGARTLWVGMPPMGNPSFSGAMGVLNAVYQARVALEQPGATYFSSWDVLGNQGVYEAGPPGFAGNGVVWRAPDGVHITQAGADVLAGALVHYLRVIGWFAPLQDAVSK